MIPLDGKTHIIIYACKRPAALQNLLSDLDREAIDEMLVSIFDDASDIDSMKVAREYATNRGWGWHRSPNQHGQSRFHEWVTESYKHLQKSEAQNFVILPDDCRLCTSFFTRLEQAWTSISDPRKIVLTFHADCLRTKNPCWTNVSPSTYNELVNKVGWVDAGFFFCTRSFFNLLYWTVRPRHVPLVYRESGVGKKITMQLTQNKLGMYLTRSSLVVHLANQSVMFPEKEQQGEPVTTVCFIDGDDRAKELGG